VARLVVELRRRTAELHGREDIDLDPTAGVAFDLLRPRREELGVSVGQGREEVVHLQRHLRSLAEGDAGDGGRGDGGCGALQEGAAGKTHGNPPVITTGVYRNRGAGPRRVDAAALAVSWPGDGS